MEEENQEEWRLTSKGVEDEDCWAWRMRIRRIGERESGKMEDENEEVLTNRQAVLTTLQRVFLGCCYQK